MPHQTNLEQNCFLQQLRSLKLNSTSVSVTIMCSVVFAEPLLTACPDFAELDVFLGQHILFTLEQLFNPKI